MARTKISEFSATPGNNTDIDGINIAEGCAPSGINDAIRELMSQLKDFQAGTAGDSFNGPVGTTTAAAGAFTTLSASSTVSGAGFSTYLASPPAIGGTAAAAGSFTTLSASSTLSVTGAGTIQGLTVGRGAGAVSTNTAVGASALAANTGAYNTAVGYYALTTNTSGQLNVALGRIALELNTTGGNNTALGDGASQANTTGSNNVSVGRQALSSNTTASNNTAVGYQAGYNNTTGAYNTVIGYQAGYAITTGQNNSALGTSVMSTGTGVVGNGNLGVGSAALYALTSGSLNTAVGCSYGAGTAVLGNNTTGSYNIAVGSGALNANTTASNNTAVGYQALYSNTTGTSNAAFGYQAGYSNTIGTYNTHTGFQSFYTANRTADNASHNTGFGAQSGYATTTGQYNTFLGVFAGYGNTTGSYNTYVGAQASTGYGCGELMTTGSKNTIIGGYSGNQGGLDIRTASNYIVLSDGDGNPRGFFNASGDYIVGNTVVNPASGFSDQKGFGYAATNGKLEVATTANDLTLDLGRNNANNGAIVGFRKQGTSVGSISVTGSATAYNTSSDYRLKDNPQPLTGSGAFIDALQPKTWNWKADGSKGVGFIAHEAQEVSPSSVVGEKDGEQMQAMEYGSAEFIANIIAELQSLRKRVAQLEGK